VIIRGEFFNWFHRFLRVTPVTWREIFLCAMLAASLFQRKSRRIRPSARTRNPKRFRNERPRRPFSSLNFHDEDFKLELSLCGAIQGSERAFTYLDSGTKERLMSL